MSEPAMPPPSVSDSVRDLVIRHLQSQEKEVSEKSLEALLEDEGPVVGRFEFFINRINEEAKEKLLISGCSAGTEFFVAKRFGFGKVVGTEIDKTLVEACTERLREESTCQVSLVDGIKLPYADNEFSMIYSSHVVEHTASPADYFAEHWRVLKAGGFFFLEFPNRYHHTELHTGLPSYEWLPVPIRNFCLRCMESSLFNRDQKSQKLYHRVRTTLSPMSVRQITRYLNKIGLRSSRVVGLEIPSPGFMRVLVRK